MSQRNRSTFVLVNPSEILQALVGLKDVRVLAYERRGRDVELMRIFGSQRGAPRPRVPQNWAKALQA